MTPNIKGNIAELAIALDCSKKGYQVSIPFGENAPYDLIVGIQKKLIRVQVKYLTMRKNGTISVPSTSTTGVKYTSDNIDYIAAYCPTNDSIYWINVDELAHSSIALRIEESKNNQAKNVRWAKDYINMRD